MRFCESVSEGRHLMSPELAGKDVMVLFFMIPLLLSLFASLTLQHSQDTSTWTPLRSRAVFPLARALRKAGCLECIIFCCWLWLQAKAELAAEVLIVGRHRQGQPHVLLKEFLRGDFAAVQAH
jgi:hypothetical protein